jgi:hypothetical protein
MYYNVDDDVNVDGDVDDDGEVDDADGDDGDDGDDDDDLDDENLTFTLEMFNSCQPALSQQRGICLTCAFF